MQETQEAVYLARPHPFLDMFLIPLTLLTVLPKIASPNTVYEESRKEIHEAKFKTFFEKIKPLHAELKLILYSKAMGVW